MSYMTVGTDSRLPRRQRTLIGLLLLVGAIAMLALPAVAAAQGAADDPTAAQYDDDSERVIEKAGGGGGLDEKVGDLPFTGVDMIAIGAVALALLALGFALRRFTSRPDAGS